jgi:hypothetical protein
MNKNMNRFIIMVTNVYMTKNMNMNMHMDRDKDRLLDF